VPKNEECVVVRVLLTINNFTMLQFFSSVGYIWLWRLQILLEWSRYKN